MSEPGAGSDLRAIASSARRTNDGWVVNRAKTFISNGNLSDLVITVVRTGRGQGGRMVRAIPKRRPGRLEEVAEVAVFLASEAASIVTGQAVSASGGLTM